MQHVKGPRFVTFLYNHNPFYLISAGLVLYGIRSSFVAGQAETDPWFLAGLIAAYSTLLALTGYLIVRIGRVWDDARSIFMVLLLLFFALSVSFDYLCVSAPTTAVTMLSLGFAFVVLLTETLLWSLQIKFPKLYKIPFYLMLAASFFYPLLFSLQQIYWVGFDKRWIVAGFPLVSAVVILSLIPAIRQTRNYVSKNGTPWEWPMFPFSLFVLLIVGLCGRSALLSMAFDPSTGPGSIFGAYFLVPIVLATLFVLLEIGIAEDNCSLQGLAFSLWPLSLVLSLIPGGNSAQTGFIYELSSTIGTPFWLAMIGLICFFAIAALRKVKDAESYLVWPLLVVVFVTRTGGIVSSVSELAIWACCVLAGLQLISARRRKESWRWLWAVVFLAVPVSNLATLFNGVGTLSGIELAIGFNWILLGAIVVAFAFSDRLAVKLRIVCATILPILATIVWAKSIADGNELIAIVYAGCLGGVALSIGRALKFPLFKYASVATLTIALLATVIRFRTEVGMEHRQLILFSAIGMGCLGVGVLISCLKAGLAKRIQKDFNRVVIDIQLLLRSLDQQGAPVADHYRADGVGENHQVE